MRGESGRVDSAPISMMSAPCSSSSERAREGAVGVDVAAAIGERIGRHVEHAHNGGALAEPNFATLELPEKEFSHSKKRGRDFYRRGAEYAENSEQICFSALCG